MRSSVVRTLCFSAVYLVATYAGRLTVMDATNLSLVWPAAGVSAVWFLVQYRSRWRALDALALSVVTVVVNTTTGASAHLAVWFVIANLLQAGSFAYLLHRWLPHLWATDGQDQLTRPYELWRLTAAAVLSTGAGALIGPTGVWVVTGTYSWPACAVCAELDAAGVAASIGWASLTPDGGFGVALDRADAAMYAAKRARVPAGRALGEN